MTKSLVNRIGGKSFSTGWLTKMIPKHQLYCEPFCGGAKLLFAKSSSPAEVLNDIDDALVNLYRVVQNDNKREALVRILNETPYSRSVFNSLRDTEIQEDAEIERAAQYLFLCRASFAGDIENGGFACPSKNTGRNPAETFRNLIGNLDVIAQRLRCVTIEHLPYDECITRYDSEQALFYCDPPYLLDDTKKARRYYGFNFVENDHRQLAECLSRVKAKVMISHYSNPLYNELYCDWRKYERNSFKGSSKAASGGEKPETVEVVYCNFEPAYGINISEN